MPIPTNNEQPAPSDEPRTTNPEPRTTNYEPRTTNYEPRTTNYEPRTTNYEPRTTNHRAPSLRKLIAACSNGKLARGAKTPEGLARSAMNSLQHGLTAATVVIRAEDPAQYEALRAAYHRDVGPRTQIESDLLDVALAALWRHRRALAMESAAYDLETERQALDIARDFHSISPDVRVWLAFRADPDLHLLHRYAARLTREFICSLRLLQDFLANPPTSPGPPTTTPDPQPPNYEPRPTNHEPRTTNYEPRTTNYEPRTPNHEPRTTNYEPRTTNYEPRVLPHEGRLSP